jgi:membrane-bound metal-dependent hydrolase YbcI (DUF457 family)
MTTLAIVALGAGLLPDVDMLRALIRSDWAFLPAVSAHRASLLHTPPFALIVGLVVLALPITQRAAWAAVAGAAVLVHLVLDSITIGPGVMWLYPWSETFYGLSLADTRYGRDWGEQWLMRYINHPLFLSEIALVIAAGLAAGRTTKGTTS